MYWYWCFERIKNGKDFLWRVPMKNICPLNHRGPCQYAPALPFATVWIPWHHKSTTDLLALGGSTVDLWIALPKISQHVRLDSPWCPTSRQMTNSDRRRARERNQVFIPYAATWMPQSFPGHALPFRVHFICLWRGLGTWFLRVLHVDFLAMFSSSFRGNHVSRLFVQTSAKYQGCLDQLVIKPNQRSPSFLLGHVRSAYRVYRKW